MFRFPYIHFGNSVKASSIIHIPLRTSSKAETHLIGKNICNLHYFSIQPNLYPFFICLGQYVSCHSSYYFHCLIALGDTANFEKMNIFFEWIFFTLHASIMVVAKCLKLICNHSWIISGAYLSPFQGSITYTGASGGLRSHILASFGNFE